MIKEILIKLGVQAEGDGLKKAGEGLDEIGKKGKGAKSGLDSIADSAKSIPGPMGKVIGAVKDTAKSMMNLAASNPYLLAIGIAVGIIYSVFKKLDPVIDKIGQVMGGLGAAFGNFVESAGKLLSGDWAGFADGVSKTFDAYSEGAEATRMLQDLEDAQEAVNLSAQRYEYQIDVLIKQSKNHNLGYKEKIALLEKAKQLQEDEINLEKKHFQEKLKALALELHATGVTYAQMIEAAKGKSVAELGITNADSIEKLKALQQFGGEYLGIQRSNEMKREKINNEFATIEENRKAKAKAQAEKAKTQEEKDNKERIEGVTKQHAMELALIEKTGRSSLEKKLQFQQEELELFKQGSAEYRDKLIEIELTKADIEKKARDEKKLRDESLRISAKEQAAAHVEDLKAIMADETLSEEERYAALDELSNLHVLNQEANSEAAIKIAKKEADAKAAGLNAVGDVFSAFADMAGRDYQDGKKLAIASSLIATYTAIAKTLSAFGTSPIPGYAIVQAIATGVAGFAAVKKIVETPDPHVKGASGGGGGSAGSMPSISAPATRAASSFVMLGNQNPINTKSVGNAKVYVVESDITKTQTKVNGIKAKATIG